MLSETAEACLAVLERGTDADWSRPAGGLEWSCRETLDHLALGLVGYAGLLIARPTDRFITLLASLDPQAPVSGCLEGIGIASKLLTTTVRGTGPEVRAWHPWGNSDPAGFAAMGIVELSMHTHDITQGLGLDWTPPEAASAAAVARLFPEAPEGHTAADTLLWSTGRTNLTGLPRRTSWQWYGAPR
ncbi:hypothetical protein HPT28_07800 [Streptomyces sp. JJ38]|nr:hypothetical protein [Streptomyces sp. JJ38]